MQNFFVKPLVAGLMAGMAVCYTGVTLAEEQETSQPKTTELLLTNGDRIKGTLVSVNTSSVIWSSESFGELTIPKEKVANFNTAKKVKIQGVEDPCVVDGMDGYYLNYTCGKDGEESEVHSIALVALDSIVPVATRADQPRSTGKISLSGTFQRGNTVEDDLEADGTTSYRHGDWRHTGVLDYDSDSTDDVPADVDYDLTYRLDRFVSERWYWYNELGYGQEESKNVDERYIYGMGAGVQLWEDPNSALAFENGLEYKKELLDPTDADLLNADWASRTEVVYYRFSTDFRYKLPFSAEFFHTNEVLYSLQDSENWELSADFGLSVPLGVGLFSEYKFEYDYDNQPSSPEADKEDTKWTIGIGYNW
ncbi:DUF481 domain-containing protein [Pseudomaricurvus sp.]|uniref:DUF481 domain-containing protein n=1 Tax=Pseudomaricurvus sp. TaxID=2004510 RepID=UPI003F6D4AFA